MVDRKQLEAMIQKARSMGATVTVSSAADGHPHEISVSGIDGIGPHPMGPIGFSEAMHRVGLGVGPNGREYVEAASEVPPQPEQAMRRAILGHFVELGWANLDGPGAGLVGKTYATAVGNKEAIAYAQHWDNGTVLTADYYSEGRNALSTIRVAVADGEDPAGVKSKVERFAADVDRAVSQTYAVSLLTLEAGEDEDGIKQAADAEVAADPSLVPDAWMEYEEWLEWTGKDDSFVGDGCRIPGTADLYAAAMRTFEGVEQNNSCSP